MDNDQKVIVKAYFKFLLAIYGMYMGFLYMMVNGGKIFGWIESKIDWIKSKFKRKEETEEI